MHTRIFAADVLLLVVGTWFLLSTPLHEIDEMDDQAER